MDHTIHLVRDSVFGQESGPTLVVALTGIALVVWDRMAMRRWDYLWVYLAGTVIWGGAEMVLQVSGIREVPPAGRSAAPARG